MLKDKIFAALRRAYEEAGTQEELQKKTGVARAQIARLLSGERSCGKIYAETLERLFPHMEICFYPDERQTITPSMSDVFLRNIAKHMANMDEDRKADCLAAIVALAASSGSIAVRVPQPEESPQKSKLAG